MIEKVNQLSKNSQRNLLELAALVESQINEFYTNVTSEYVKFEGRMSYIDAITNDLLVLLVTIQVKIWSSEVNF